MKYKFSMKILLILSITILFGKDAIAYVYYVDGDVLVKNNLVMIQYKEAISGRAIYSGDEIKTNENSKCVIYFKDKTSQVSIDSNSRIKILETNFSKEIKIDEGSAFIHNVDSSNKFYVMTYNNQYFLENDRVWISSDFHNGDVLFSLDNSINIFSKINNRSMYFDENRVHYFFNSGKMQFSNSNNDIVPQYVLDKVNDEVYESSDIVLKDSDLIPIYGKRIRPNQDESLMSYYLSFGSLQLNSQAYSQLAFNAKYKHNNLSFGFNFDPVLSSNSDLLENDWDDVFDFIDRFYLNYYRANDDKNNQMYLRYGHHKDISFSHGYLLNKLTNNLDYPRLRNSGLYLDYKFDDNFMDLQIFIPDFKDFFNSGGIIAGHTSLYISHNFPLTLGLGIVADINQLSFIEDQYEIDFVKKRNVYGVSFDFYYDLFRIKNIDISLYGEFVGIWYPESIYYVLYDNSNNVANDLRYRKGVWGIKSPGVHIDFNNRLELKLSYNHNSALFIPSYFDSNYLTNRARYYNGNLNFPLVNQQINLLNEYSFDVDEFIVPKDLYPILFQNKGFSPYQIQGVTAELNYNIRNYLNLNVLTSIYIENSEDNDMFYSFDCELEITDNFIRRVSFINLYFSNNFFIDISDKERMTFGLKTGIDLPLRLSLIIDVGQVYYDLNLQDNELNQMINSSFGLKYKF